MNEPTIMSYSHPLQILMVVEIASAKEFISNYFYLIFPPFFNNIEMSSMYFILQ